MNEQVGTAQSPWTNLIILLGFTLGCSVGISLFVLLLTALINGDIQALLRGTSSLNSASASTTYLLLAGSSIGTFLLPAYFLQRINARYFQLFPTYRIGDVKLYVFAFLFLLVCNPLMSVVSAWNMGLSLPESFAPIELWMRQQEDAMGRLTGDLVMVDSIPLLLANLVVIAVIPAIAEELFFRGALQHIFQRIFKNEHLTVWVVGIIFSAIHVQFFGFFPRLLLGVFFGYLFVWSRNIWVPIFAHFVNNASVTLLAFYYTRQGKTFQDLQTFDSYTLIVYLGSFIASVLFAWLFYNNTKNIRIDGKGLGEN